jgi:hypothetical protein
MMNIIFEYANEMMEIDKSTMTLLLFICGAAKWMIRNHLTNSAMVFVMYPFTMLFSMCAYTVFNRFELFAASKHDQWMMWTIMAATVGVVVTLLITAGLMRLSETVSNRSHKRMTEIAPNR